LSSTGRRLAALMTATALSAGLAHAQEVGNAHDKSNAAASGDAALLKKLEQMEQRIRVLENQLKQKDNREIAHAHGQVPVGAVPPADSKPAKDRKDADDSSLPKQAKGTTGGAKPDWATPASRDLSGKTAPINPPNSIIGLTDSPVTGMSIGAYGEMKFG